MNLFGCTSGRCAALTIKCAYPKCNDRRAFGVRPSTGSLIRVSLQRSEPWMCLMDNREIIAAILTAVADLACRWADQTGVGWHYIAPGKPQQNRAERLRRKLQRQAARRAAERDAD